jgi:4-amino-4-deoxychorismate mutase
MEELIKHREKLDTLDEKIIALLGERYAICREVAKHKKENDIPMMQTGRVEAVKKRCEELAIQHNIDPSFIRNLYGLIIDEACRLEDDIIGRP